MDPYQELGVSPQANAQQIKQAYRRLAKTHHPDAEGGDHDRIVRLNAAYEILGDPQKRRQYDLGQSLGYDAVQQEKRQDRTARAQQAHQDQRGEVETEQQILAWIKEIYTPVDRQVYQILKPLKSQINALADDPFDDELMGNFLTYLEQSQTQVTKAKQKFQSRPNPRSLAKVAATLYHCLNQLEDAFEQLTWFTTNYDEHDLHRGQELCRIARSLRSEAKEAIRQWRSS